MLTCEGGMYGAYLRRKTFAYQCVTPMDTSAHTSIFSAIYVKLTFCMSFGTAGACGGDAKATCTLITTRQADGRAVSLQSCHAPVSRLLWNRGYFYLHDSVFICTG